MDNLTLNNFGQHWSSVKPDKLNNFLESTGVEELDDAALMAVVGGAGAPPGLEEEFAIQAVGGGTGIFGSFSASA